LETFIVHICEPLHLTNMQIKQLKFASYVAIIVAEGKMIANYFSLHLSLSLGFTSVKAQCR